MIYLRKERSSMMKKYIFYVQRMKYGGKLCLKAGVWEFVAKNTARWLFYIFLFLFWAKNSAYKIEDYVLFAQDNYETLLC